VRDLADVDAIDRRDAPFMPVPSPLTVHVDHDRHGVWEVELPDGSERVVCETLEDAKRVAYLCAASRYPCELVVRDAYHRVLHREFIDGDDDAARPTPRGREPLTLSHGNRFPARRRGVRR
jgi:hypothetical protein